MKEESSTALKRRATSIDLPLASAEPPYLAGVWHASARPAADLSHLSPKAHHGYCRTWDDLGRDQSTEL